MVSPRHEDFDPLLDALIGRVKIIQERLGEFLPIAAIVSPDGRVIDVIARPGTEAQPGANKVLKFLEVALRALAKQNKCRSIGIALDARFARKPEDPKTDAIQVFLEHRDGSALNIALPYQKNAGGQFTYDRPVAFRAEPKIFLKIN